VRALLAAILCHKGDVDRNLAAHLGLLAEARAEGCELALFPGFDWWKGSALGDARRHARRQGLWIALAGQAGSTVDEDFPGLAALVGPDGDVTARLADWRPGVLLADIPG
jgi:predicted amidohydrolase